MTFSDGNRLGLVSLHGQRAIYADRWHGAVSRWKAIFLAWGMQDRLPGTRHPRRPA